MRRHFFLMIMMVAMALTTAAQGIQFSQGSLKTLLEQASREKKLLFIDCYTTWCGPCKWMEANTFKEEKAGSFFGQKFVAAKFDMEKGEGLSIAEKYEVQAYPTYIILDGTGKLVHRAVGSMMLDDFMKMASNAVNPATQYATLKAKYDSGVRDTAFLATYIPILAMAGGDATPVADQYLNAMGEKNVLSKRGWQMITNNIQTLNSQWVTFVSTHNEEFSKLTSSDEINEWIEYVVQNTMREARQSGLDGLEPFKDILRKRVPAQATNYELAAEYYFRESLPLEESHPFAKGWFDEMCQSANELNSIAWSYFERVEDETMLTDALQWARRSVILQPSYYNTDTEANILAKLGRWKEAEKAAMKAIDLAEKAGEDAEATQELLTEIRKHL